MRSHRSAANQVCLPLTRRQRFGSLRAIDPDTLGVGRRAWSRVVDLLEQVELCSQRDGCHAYAETLAARMAGGIGVSESTLHRTRRLAQRLGLLATRHRHDGHRQQSNVWAVDWTRITGLAGIEVTAPLAEGTTDTPGYQTDTPGCQTDTLLIGTASTKTSTTTFGRLGAGRSEKDRSEKDRSANGLAAAGACPRGRAPAEGPTPARRPRVAIPAQVPPPLEHLARRVVARIGKPQSARDLEAAWKWAAAASVLGEAWLADLCEAPHVVETRPRNPWAYCARVAQQSAAEQGVSLAQLMARTDPPPRDWQWRREPRLCVEAAEL